MSGLDTRVTRFLDRHSVPYRLLPHSEPVFTVADAAAQRGVVAEEMVKSLLLRDRARRYVLACVTGPDRVDLKAVRAELPAAWRRLTFASSAEIEEVTGFVMGAVAPLTLPQEVPVIFDVAIGRCAHVNISSGHPLAGLELDGQVLIRLAGARLAPIAER